MPPSPQQLQALERLRIQGQLDARMQHAIDAAASVIAVRMALLTPQFQLDPTIASMLQAIASGNLTTLETAISAVPANALAEV